MEHWIVYNAETGAPIYPGSGGVGSAAIQEAPDGAAVMQVPPGVVTSDWPNLNLVPLRAALATKVDAEAERVRMLFLTPGMGQAMTYARKEVEARARVADQSATVPFLEAEALARSMTIDELAVEVVAQADQWVVVGSAVEALRMGAKTAIAAAATLPALLAASTVDWQSLSA